MLSALNKGFWRKGGFALGLFAALCFTLPPAVLAMGHGANTVSCLSHADRVDHGMKTGHADHGIAQNAARLTDERDHAPSSADGQMTCCGLYCLSAVAASESRIGMRPGLGVPRGLASEPRLISRTPPLLERPPNPHLSV